MYANVSGNKERQFDAIVIGSGISGGWAAKELTQRGLKTILLDRGRDVKHGTDYPTALMHPWDFQLGLLNPIADQQKNPVQSQVYNQGDKLFFVDDSTHPYIQEKPFNWLRGYQVGGRSLTWGRQCYRLSDLDFEANLKDGIGVDWPIRYNDIKPWYDYVEAYVGVSGRVDGLAHLPDGPYLPPMELNCVERYLETSVRQRFGRLLTVARVANLTKGWNGRGPCQYRNLCSRGCPYGGYFSSNSATIPEALRTGNLTLRPFSIVSEILYDDTVRKARGVRVIDAVTHETSEFYARIIFINASTIATAAILLNSKSNRFPNGLGNDSGQVGRNLMDHHSSAGASGTYNGFSDQYYHGRRPAGFLIPRFRNLGDEASKRVDFHRGYQIQGQGKRDGWQENVYSGGFGAEFKSRLTTPGGWNIWMGGWGECLPYEDNRVTLDEVKVDQWNMPLIKVDFSFRQNEERMQYDIQQQCHEMLDAAGFKNIDVFNYHKAGGSTIHEMGTTRMGNEPSTSVLNKFNQVHDVKNVFITDGGCMTSSACQNPSLTYMALTARACNYAFNQMKLGKL